MLAVLLPLVATRSCSRARRAQRAAARDAREPVRASSAARAARSRPTPARRSRGRASWRAAEGAVLVTGSIYLLSDLARAARCEAAPSDRRHARMLGLVAIVVAVVILVFFAARLRPRAAAALLARNSRSRDPASALGYPCLAGSSCTRRSRVGRNDPRPFRHRERRPQPGRQPAGLLPGRDLGRARLLDVRGREPAAGRPDAGRLRDRGVAVPLHRHDRLHDRAPARVPRGPPRARARDQGRREAARAAREPNLPQLRRRGGARASCAARAACASCKEPCASCGKPLDPRWRVCPYCEAEVAASLRSAASRAARRRQERPHGGRQARSGALASAGERQARPRPARARPGRRAGLDGAPTIAAPRQRTTSQPPPNREGPAPQ